MRAQYLFYTGILFSSLDSFSLFASISTYTPFISVLFFSLYYLCHFRNISDLKFSKRRAYILLILLFCTLYSAYKGAFYYYDYKGFVNFVIQLAIAIILYKSFNCYFSHLDNAKYCKQFSRTFIKYTFPILVIGLFELLIFPFKDIYSSFISLFSYRVSLERIQLISGEPSWASRLLLIYLALIPLANYSRKTTIFLVSIGLLLLFATGSALGIICVGLYYTITYFKREYIFRYISICAIFLLLTPILYLKLSDYTQARIELLSQLDSNDIETLAVEAGSGAVMARLGNPVVAMYMGKDNILCGVGGGYFYYHYEEYLGRYFPNALNIRNIDSTGSTAKNLIARIFAETGLFGLIPFLWVLIWVYKMKVKSNTHLKGVFIAMILLTINFDTLFHIFPLLLFCFLLNFPSKE